MTRRLVLLGGLAAVLLVVLFWLLLWTPKQEQLAELDTQIADAQALQVQLQAQVTGLREVRERAPEVQALLAASETIVPHDPAMPSALRQLQQAASEAQLTLRSVSPGRPQAVSAEGLVMEPGTELVTYPVGLLVEGGYFQVVDFLRRVEDPSISPRGFTWATLNASVLEYPTLTVDLSGAVYAVVPAGGIPEAPADADPVEGDEAPTTDDEPTESAAEEDQ
jgi:Tfp pilus assembly protein PilO